MANCKFLSVKMGSFFSRSPTESQVETITRRLFVGREIPALNFSDELTLREIRIKQLGKLFQVASRVSQKTIGQLMDEVRLYELVGETVVSEVLQEITESRSRKAVLTSLM